MAISGRFSIRSIRRVFRENTGVQYLSLRCTERLANALAETVIGLYKTELIHRRGLVH